MTNDRAAELETETEWRESYPLMSQLRTDLAEERYLEFIRSKDGEYRLFARRDTDKIVSLAGVEVLENLYHGHHLWVHELVTHNAYRSRGLGADLLDYLAEWSREKDCDSIVLSSGLGREDAHRFYEERTDLERVSYVFKASL